MPLSAAFVQETTVFREFGPLAGNTMRRPTRSRRRFGGLLSRQTIDVDARHYLRLGAHRRAGDAPPRLQELRRLSPNYIYFGGNSEMHGYDYLQFAGQNVVFANAELRFPIIEAALTPIGVVGGVRGVFFANIGGGWFGNQVSPDSCIDRRRLQVLHQRDRNLPFADGVARPTARRSYGPPLVVNGFRLKDGRASYGLGLETFALGFPIHFDWSWRTTVQQDMGRHHVRRYNGCSITGVGCSDACRKPQFAVWIGYDF